MKLRLAIWVLAAVLPAAGVAEEASSFSTDRERASYAFGLQVGQNLKSQSIELDQAALLAGIADVLGGTGSRFTMDELRTAMLAYQKEVLERQAERAEQNLKAAEAFLVTNRDAEGVVQLESGLQYKIIRSGEGAHPGSEDTVSVHYRGRLVDGTEFDSSYGRGEPASLQLGQVIEGWQQALALMRPGDKWEVYVPPDLAYGPSGAGADIGPNEALIFEIELLTIQ